jgi:hypothetical protein
MKSQSDLTVAEQVILEEGDVRITNLRAVFAAKTYAISNITSVSFAKREASWRLAFVLMLIGVVFLAVSVIALLTAFTSGSIPDSATWVVLVIGGIALAAVSQAYKSASATPTFIVRIAGASGESDALSSRDRAWIERIVSALNQAIVMKG